MRGERGRVRQRLPLQRRRYASGVIFHPCICNSTDACACVRRVHGLHCALAHVGWYHLHVVMRVWLEKKNAVYY